MPANHFGVLVERVVQGVKQQFSYREMGCCESAGNCCEVKKRAHLVLLEQASVAKGRRSLTWRLEIKRSEVFCKFLNCFKIPRDFFFVWGFPGSPQVLSLIVFVEIYPRVDCGAEFWRGRQQIGSNQEYIATRRWSSSNDNSNAVVSTSAPLAAGSFRFAWTGIGAATTNCS